MSNWLSKQTTQIDLRTTIKFKNIGNQSFVFELVKFDEKLTETPIRSYTFNKTEVLLIFQFKLANFEIFCYREIKYQWIRKENLTSQSLKLTHLSKLELKFTTISRIHSKICSLSPK